MLTLLTALFLTFPPAGAKAAGAKAAEAEADAATQALKKLQGKYVLEALEVNGIKVPPNKVEGTILMIKGDAYTVRVKDRETICKISLDPGKDPMHMDMVFTDGEKKDKIHKGIYKVEEGLLHVARGLDAEQARPGQFATWPDTNYFVATWRRQD